MLEVFDDIRLEARGLPVDAAIATIADSQHGVVARRQLVALGIGSGAIQHRLSIGRLHRVFHGVYAVGRSGLSAQGRWMAAVLTCGETAVLSHRSAAALWGIAPYAASSIEITVPGARRRRRRGIRVHGNVMGAAERTTRHGIPTTSVSRTLLDLCEVVDGRRLERAVEEAERLELLDLGAIARLCQRRSGRRGRARLRAAMDALGPIHVTRSELEWEFLALCRSSNLSTPAMNIVVEGLEVDAVWKQARLVVELDGYAFHRTRGAFERDRGRDARLLLAGYRVLRVTARRLRDDPESVVATIRRLLASPRARPNQ